MMKTETQPRTITGYYFAPVKGAGVCVKGNLDGKPWVTTDLV